MEGKKKLLIFMLIILFGFLGVIFFINNNKIKNTNINEIVPEEEISDSRF